MRQRMSIPPEDIVRRHFVAIATHDYSHPALKQLPGIADEVDILRNWLCNEALGPRRFTMQYPELASNPTKQQIRAALEDPEPACRWNRTDAVVLFVTGHGVKETGTHFVILQDSDVNRLDATAIKTADLVAWLTNTDIEHLLIVVDMCYAGQAMVDTIRLSRRIPDSWIILASVTDEPARTGALTSAVTGFFRQLSSPDGIGRKFSHGPYLRVDEFLGEIQERLGPAQRLATLQQALPLLARESPCLPNPLYRHEGKPSVGAARSDLALPPADLDAHWDPRGRGVIKPEDLDWLFTGRVRLMRRLIKAATGEPVTLLITGRAGCGKSAALARLVTLSDQAYVDRCAEQIARIRDDLKPPTGAVDVAVLATGKTAAEIMIQICGSLGVPSVNGPATDLGTAVDAWQKWIESDDRLVTIVIDALDEASNPKDVLEVVLRALRSDGSAQRRVRLLLGIRSPGGAGQQEAQAAATVKLPPLADRAEVLLAPVDRIRVDESPWWSRSDVTDYTTSLLLAPTQSPYRVSSAPATSTIAEAIADAASTSYLIARIAANALAERATAIDPDDLNWRTAINEGVLGVFRDDLHHTLTDASDRERAVHLLRAVAFAYGRGLPWRTIWPLVANAVADDSTRYPAGGAPTYGDTDIAWLLGNRIGAYLLTDQEDGITVYRLFHDDLRVILQERWQDLLEDHAPSG